ncbi:MAG: CcmD family protein [bacterium]
MQNLEYLFGAYSLIWIFIVLYLFYIGKKQYKIIREIEKNKKS